MTDFSLQEEIDQIKKEGLYRSLKEITSDQSAIVIYQKKKLLNFSSNNYLSLANDPRLKQAAQEAVSQFGCGSGASRLVSGSMSLHHQLEKKVSHFKKTESALLFNSGYHANLGIISALMKEGDEIYSDELNHASIIDACRLSKARTQVYRHLDSEHLEKLLQSSHKKVRRRLIVSDSVFSMDGDTALLDELMSLAQKYDAYLMLDEAHATGVLGKNGKGLVEHYWPDQSPTSFIQERVIQMGTFGKALGSFGAYVACSSLLCELFINKSRSFIYTTSLAPALLAASLRALEIVEQESDRRKKLWQNINTLFKNLSDFNPSIQNQKPASAIIPLILPDPSRCLSVAETLFQKGFFVSAIRYPTVAKGKERLRLTLMTDHETSHIQQLCDELKKMI